MHPIDGNLKEVTINIAHIKSDDSRTPDGIVPLMDE
jgi:hypothetical protein